MAFWKKRRGPRPQTPEELSLAQQEKTLLLEAKRLALQGDADAQAYLAMVLPNRGGRGHKAAPQFPTRQSDTERLTELLQLMQLIQGQQKPQEDEIEKLMRYRRLMVELRKLDGPEEEEGGGGTLATIARAAGQGIGTVLERAMESYADGELMQRPRRKALAPPAEGEESEEEAEGDVNLFKMFQVLRDARAKFDELPAADYARWLLTVDAQAKAMAQEWADSTDDEVFEMLRGAKNSPDTLAPVKKLIAAFLANPEKTRAIVGELRVQLGVTPPTPTGPGTPQALPDVPPEKRVAI